MQTWGTWWTWFVRLVVAVPVAAGLINWQYFCFLLLNHPECIWFLTIPNYGLLNSHELCEFPRNYPLLKFVSHFSVTCNQKCNQICHQEGLFLSLCCFLQFWILWAFCQAFFLPYVGKVWMILFVSSVSLASCLNDIPRPSATPASLGDRIFGHSRWPMVSHFLADANGLRVELEQKSHISVPLHWLMVMLKLTFTRAGTQGHITYTFIANSSIF